MAKVMGTIEMQGVTGTIEMQGVTGTIEMQRVTGTIIQSDTTPSGAAYDTDLLTYIDGLTTPLSGTQLGYINTYLTNKKTGLVISLLSEAFDVLYYLGNETPESSLRNMVKRAHDATAVNSPTFTPYEGFTGDGISSYIDTNYKPVVDTQVMSANNSSYGAYVRNFGPDDIAFFYGNLYSGNYTHLYRNINNLYYRHQNSSAAFYKGGLILGMHITTRIESGYFDTIVNGILKNHLAIVDAGLINRIIPLLAWLNNYSITATQNKGQISFWFAGKGFDNTECGIITDAFEALMDANGKGVIT